MDHGELLEQVIVKENVAESCGVRQRSIGLDASIGNGNRAGFASEFAESTAGRGQVAAWDVVGAMMVDIYRVKVRQGWQSRLVR